MPPQDQLGLAIVTNPHPPPRGQITFVPASPIFYVGEQITITTYVQNRNPGPVACQVEFFVNSAGAGNSCEPLHINQDVYNSPNPTPALVLNPGATAPVALVWIVDQAYGPTAIYAQVRATDCGALSPCDAQLWNASRGCTIFPSLMLEVKRLQQPASENLYCSLGISNPGDSELRTKFSVESLREGDQGAEDIREIQYLRSLGGSWLHAEPRQLKLALGTDRATRSETGGKTRLEQVRMLSPRIFDLSVDSEARHGEAVIDALLSGGEGRQVLLQLEHSRGAQKKDFYVLRVSHKSGANVWGDQLIVLRCDHEF
jgi:hypothetical protein